MDVLSRTIFFSWKYMNVFYSIPRCMLRVESSWELWAKEEGACPVTFLPLQEGMTLNQHPATSPLD
jgi:hypothetical protein